MHVTLKRRHAQKIGDLIVLENIFHLVLVFLCTCQRRFY